MGGRSVEDFLNRPRFELYDVENDPDETKNLAQDPTYAAILERMTTGVRNRQRAYGDPWVVKWAYE